MATEQKVIMVEVRSVYGTDLIYPACDAAQQFCKIAGTRTLPPSILPFIRALGYEISQAQQISKVLA